MSTRILALDHGTVRIGVAISDDMLMIAQPEPYVPAEPPEAIETYIHEQWEGSVKAHSCGHASQHGWQLWTCS